MSAPPGYGLGKPPSSSSSLAAARTTAIGRALDAAERQSGTARRQALTRLAAQVDADVGARDQARVRAMAGAIRDLARATR